MGQTFLRVVERCINPLEQMFCFHVSSTEITSCSHTYKHFLMKACSFSRDLEEDPLFGDDPSPDSRLSGSDWVSSSPPQSPDHSKSDGKTEVHKIVNRYTVCS